ncbi:MAG: SH3 domain-containing protein [Oscillospiraceae bacterium]|nr:SH3 domain-containing protein [Oscillospiraceae bacterium]
MKFFRLLVCLTAACLLCGCTSLDSAGSGGTGTDTAASGTQVSGTAASGTADSGTQASGESADTTAQTKPGIPSDAVDVRTAFPKGGSVVLSGSGVVFARDGLNLRSQPSASSQKITLLKHGTAVKVKNAVCTGVSKKHNPECWYQVDAGGKTGFVSAEFVAVSFDTPDSAMDDTQRSALGILLFRQAYKLNWYFTQEGGISATAYLTQKQTADGWIPLEPKGLTAEKILSDYKQYFDMDFPYPIEDSYKQTGDTLYVTSNFPENFYVDYEELAFLTGKTNDSITYRTKAQWYTSGEFVMYTENNGVTEEDFIIRYTDGIWKVARFIPAI